MNTPNFHSKFGGLWIDGDDWRAQAAARKLTAGQTQLVEHFVRDGFVILEQAAPLDSINAFQREIERSFREGNPALLYQAHGDQTTRPLEGPVNRLGTRVVDSFVALPQALKLFSSPRLMDFLSVIFGEDPLLFQSLSFDQGSQQGLHRDTAYVVVNRPIELAACWIALEDVQAGSGELMYAAGSHRLPDWEFGEGRKHWNRQADGDAAHEDWSVKLRVTAEKSPRGVQRFLARKGDILIWHADLAHGGAPVERPELTRQSLVGHFCPQSAEPYYFSNDTKRATVRHYGRLAYSSAHYDLATLAPGPDADDEAAPRSWLKRLLGGT